MGRKAHPHLQKRKQWWDLISVYHLEQAYIPNIHCQYPTFPFFRFTHFPFKKGVMPCKQSLELIQIE